MIVAFVVLLIAFAVAVGTAVVQTVRKDALQTQVFQLENTVEALTTALDQLKSKKETPS